MILLGKGRLRHLRSELKHPQARRLSIRLEKVCGCKLAYHTKRRCWVVFRERGSHRAPRTYMDLPKHQLRGAMIPYIKDAVKWADLKAAGNFERMMDIHDKHLQDANKKTFESHLEECLPDLCRAMHRVREVLQTGRVNPKFMDFGAIKTPTGGPTG